MECNFPEEMASFGLVLTDVTEYHSTRTKLTADMADSSQRVKALVVRAEVRHCEDEAHRGAKRRTSRSEASNWEYDNCVLLAIRPF